MKMENPFYFIDYNTYILIFGHIPNTQKLYRVHGKNAPVYQNRERIRISPKNQPDVAENNSTKEPSLASLLLQKYYPINIYTIKKYIGQVNKQYAREAGRLPDLLV